MITLVLFQAEVVPLAENSNETSQSKRLPDVQKNQDIRSRLKRISTPLGEVSWQILFLFFVRVLYDDPLLFQGTIVRISRSSLVGEHATGEAAVNPTGTADGSGGMVSMERFWRSSVLRSFCFRIILTRLLETEGYRTNV